MRRRRRKSRSYLHAYTACVDHPTGVKEMTLTEAPRRRRRLPATLRPGLNFFVFAFRQAPIKRQVRWVFEHLRRDLLVWSMTSLALTICATPSSAGECRLPKVGAGIDHTRPPMSAIPGIRYLLVPHRYCRPDGPSCSFRTVTIAMSVAKRQAEPRDRFVCSMYKGLLDDDAN